MHPRLLLSLLRFFAMGAIQATQVQAMAAAAWADGWGRGDDLSRRVASAGSQGRHTSNILRDILRAAEIAALMTVSQPYTFTVPGPGGAPVSLSCFLPHEVYTQMFDLEGIDGCCLGPEALEAPTGLGPLIRAWVDHVDVTVRHNPLRVGAIGMHCDGVQYTTSMRAGGAKGIFVGSFNLLSGRTPA